MEKLDKEKIITLLKTYKSIQPFYIETFTRDYMRKYLNLDPQGFNEIEFVYVLENFLLEGDFVKKNDNNKLIILDNK